MADSMLEQIIAAQKKMSEMPPIIVEIWFVDRQHQYRDYLLLAPMREAANTSLFSVRIYEWYMRYFHPSREKIDDPDDMTEFHDDGFRHYPWICRHPGVWCKWHNGKWSLMGDWPPV